MKTKLILLATLAILAGSAGAASQSGSGRVMIAPVQVEFHKDWLADMNATRGRTYRLGRDEARRIAGEMAAAVQAALSEAFRARGFEVVTTPAPDVTLLSASVRDLYVNAPDSASSARVYSFVREAGHATLALEGRDAATGNVRVNSVSREATGDTGRFERASDVSNRFWFEAMFRRWAADQALALASTK